MNSAQAVNDWQKYYEKPLLDSVVGVYLDVLDTLDAGTLQAVYTAVIDGCKWMPKVAELREIIQQVQAGSVADQVEAWHADRNAVQSDVTWVSIGFGGYVPVGYVYGKNKIDQEIETIVAQAALEREA